MAKNYLELFNYYDVIRKLSAKEFNNILRFLRVFKFCEVSDTLAVKEQINDILRYTPWVIYRECLLYHPVYNSPHYKIKFDFEKPKKHVSFNIDW